MEYAARPKYPVGPKLKSARCRVQRDIAAIRIDIRTDESYQIYRLAGTRLPVIGRGAGGLGAIEVSQGWAGDDVGRMVAVRRVG